MIKMINEQKQVYFFSYIQITKQCISSLIVRSISSKLYCSQTEVIYLWTSSGWCDDDEKSWADVDDIQSPGISWYDVR